MLNFTEIATKRVRRLIREIRAQHDGSYAEASRILGLSPSMIWQVANGRTRVGLDSVSQICRHTGMTIQELLE